ncbi:MAG: hypothetical protein ACFFA6_16540 [Promethearchaeota archaeon]
MRRTPITISVIATNNPPSQYLLYLIKECFKDDTEFKEWLDLKNIQFNFSSFT